MWDVQVAKILSAAAPAVLALLLASCAEPTGLGR